MDPEFQEALDDAKASLHFVVNLFYVGYLILVELLLFNWLVPRHLIQSQIQWVLILALLLAIILVTSHPAISRAVAWGVYLRTASDIYMDRLLEKLGRKAPREPEQRRTP